jgi:hypothetical protein
MRIVFDYQRRDGEKMKYTEIIGGSNKKLEENLAKDISRVQRIAIHRLNALAKTSSPTKMKRVAGNIQVIFIKRRDLFIKNGVVEYNQKVHTIADKFNENLQTTLSPMRKELNQLHYEIKIRKERIQTLVNQISSIRNEDSKKLHSELDDTRKWLEEYHSKLCSEAQQEIEDYIKDESNEKEET